MSMNNWGSTVSGGGTGGGVLTFSDNGSQNAIVIVGDTLSAGDLFVVTSIVADNTGATTIAINGASAISIVGQNGLALQGGELSLAGDALFLMNSVGTVTMMDTTNGSIPVKDATQTDQAVNLGQLNTATNGTLKTANNLSEISTAGTQATARTNLGVPASTDVLYTANNLSEIAAAGSTAQSAARTNLGITGGSSSGQFLGTMSLASSGTYSLPTGTTYLIAEVVAGGGGSGGIPAVTTTSISITDMGNPGARCKIYIPVSQLSTAATNQISVVIGAGGSAGAATGSGGNGGNTTIDTNVVIAGGGIGSAVGVNISNTTGTRFFPNYTSTTAYVGTAITAAIPGNLLEVDDYIRLLQGGGRPGISIYNGTIIYHDAVFFSVFWSALPFTFYKQGTASGGGGLGGYGNGYTTAARVGSAGYIGEIFLECYS